MKLKSVEIENYRAIEKLKLSLDPVADGVARREWVRQDERSERDCGGVGGIRICLDRFSMYSLIFARRIGVRGQGIRGYRSLSTNGKCF